VCIVSNTNENIANLVSKSVSASRDEGVDNSCCSLIFNRLDNVDKQVISIEARVDLIRDYCVFERNHLPEFDSIFDRLFNNWFYTCRPGIAVWIADAIDKLLEVLQDPAAESYLLQQQRQGQYALGNSFTIGSFLQFLCAYVADKLRERKRFMVLRLNGQVAKLGLMTDAAYTADSALIAAAANASLPHTFNFIQFLENHLYYLVNPTGTNLDYFITFRPEDTRMNE
jgi:hypothetical protein